MDRSRQSIDLTRVSGNLAVQRNLMPSQVWVGGESDFLGEACSAVEERHCQAHWILHASGANNDVRFAFLANSFKVRQKLQTDKFDFDRFKRRHVLLRVSYFGWDYMGLATQVLSPLSHTKTKWWILWTWEAWDPGWLETSGGCWQVDWVRIVCSVAPD